MSVPKANQRPLPKAEHRQLETPFGSAIGAAYQWEGGQYCAIHTSRGLIGCGVYSIECANEFNMAFAIAKGTPQHPLFEPEDLYEAKIIAVSQAAQDMGISTGMTGIQALEKMLSNE
ncbi:MAG: DUF1805 domain-containing protein [Planctomycetaceae bacterium]|nr:DUF1805 domain-containing protein [Planctomycetaceae bacterium]